MRIDKNEKKDVGQTNDMKEKIVGEIDEGNGNWRREERNEKKNI